MNAIQTIALMPVAKGPHDSIRDAIVMDIPERQVGSAGLMLPRNAKSDNPTFEMFFKGDELPRWAKGFPDETDNPTDCRIQKRIIDPEVV